MPAEDSLRALCPESQPFPRRAAGGPPARSTRSPRGKRPDGRVVPMIDILEGLDGALLAPARPDLAGLVPWGGGGGRPIHRWFRYREGFSPALISELRLGHRILDPFCGSGSIMVGAAQQGRISVGIDVNPLAAFVGRVKLSPISDSDVVAATAFLHGFESAVGGAEPWPNPALRSSAKGSKPEIM